MSKYNIQITLKSATTFGCGDGVAGYIDTEVGHDEFGLPYLHGRTLKGLLQEECANILFSLSQDATFTKLSDFETASNNLFGTSGSDLDADAKMNVGDAVIQEDLANAVKFAIEKNQITADEVLQSLTTIRRQTAMNENGSPKPESLRLMRVILSETIFESNLSFNEGFAIDSDEITLLRMSCAALQRVGLGRNRGRGKVAVRLIGAGDGLKKFEEMI
jgi:CRISPR/Cas system CMR subunit Cmr4 (Cas7 group RAMP superfamily)